MLRSAHPVPTEWVTARIGRVFTSVPVSPNTWTLLSIVPALAGLYALATGWLVGGLVLFAVAGFIDVIDGAVARARDQTSAYGAYLDGMVDRIVEAMLLVGLMLFGYPDWVLPGWLWLALVLFFGTTMTAFARAYADHRGIVTQPDDHAAMGGLLERAERLLLVYASMLLWFISPILATYTIALTATLGAITVGQRMHYARTVA